MRRRKFLHSSALLAFAPLLPEAAHGTDRQVAEFRLRAAPGTFPLVGEGYPETPVWSYEGQIPGPEIRARQGERLRVVVENGLAQPTSVHWHGVRLPNAMDGVPGLTQDPIAPGDSFAYEFEVADAGTFWYHPHFRSFEQIGRGLAGPLIVEERNAIAVDREQLWVIDDWRLTQEATIAEDFGDRHDMSHAGRIGNVVTINGQLPETWPVRAGERVRLRLINTANARNCALRFEGHEPLIVAIDGHPVPPHAPADGKVILAAATRVDLLLDMVNSPGSRFRVIDEYYSRLAYRLIDLAYSDEAPVRSRASAWDIGLRPNPVPEPDIARAVRHEIVFSGGAMGGLRGARFEGEWADMRALASNDVFWVVNGVARRPGNFDAEPLLSLERGTSHVLAMQNNTAFPHPMHLHGHAFRVLSRNGRPVAHQPWQDTVLMDPRESVEIAFKADNPGHWLFHCHVLEHMASGMSGVVRVV